jgi:uncharacterized repeat protein (TIGR02543 family)
VSAYRKGYWFLGWSTDQDATTPEILKDDVYNASVPSEDTTLYAVWVKISTITFDANGGQYSEGDDEDSKKTTWTLEYPPNSIFETSVSAYRQGYILLGWSTNQNATTPEILSDDMYNASVPVEDTTFYAVWAKTSIITFDANGGQHSEGNYTYCKETTWTSELVAGGTFGMSESAYRKGYTLLGWSTDQNAATPEISKHDMWDASVPAEDTTLYAVWAKDVLVTFDANGGQYSDGDDEDSKKTTWTLEFSPSGTFNTWVSAYRKGYRFLGWSTDQNATTPEILENEMWDTSVPADGTTLYAVWKKTNAITFDANGGQYSKGNTTYSKKTSWTYEFDADGTFNRYVSAYRKGYTFLGWSTDQNATTPEILENDMWDASVPADGTTLYAVWTKNSAITFVANGGQYSYGDTSYSKKTSWTLEFIAGGTFNTTESAYRKGYTFLGWSTDQNATTPEILEDDMENASVPREDTTLYAVWKKNSAITFDANGGQHYSGDDAKSKATSWTYEYIEDGTFYIPENAYREGYRFLGWSTDQNATMPEIWLNDMSDTPVPADGTTLYAVWEKISIITFNANGGQYHEGDDANDRKTTWTREYAASGTLYSEDAYQEGYLFLGWSTDQNATTPEIWIDDMADTPVPADGTTLYAVWDKISTITFDANGGQKSDGSDEDSKKAIWTVDFSEGETFGYKVSAYRKGYELKGWSTQKNSETPEYELDAMSDSVVPADGTILYAVWGKVEQKSEQKIIYKSHVQKKGTLDWVENGAISGTSGQGLRMEALYIMLQDADYTGSVEYRAYVQKQGWQDWSADGTMAGTKDQGLRLEAVQIRLTDEMAEHYDIYYCVHAQHYGWLNWAKNGKPAGTAGFGYRLEAICVELVKKGDPAPEKIGSDPVTYHKKTSSTSSTTASVTYRSHVQTYGNLKWVSDGAMTGTKGESKRMEAIYIKLASQPYSGDIEYESHIQKNGWEKEWKKNGEMSGTSGEKKRLEAIRIRLTGEMAQHYDVYYRVYAQHFGWLGWAKNGANSGTAGYGYRLEGIEVKLVPKGQAAPGSTENAFRQNK